MGEPEGTGAGRDDAGDRRASSPRPAAAGASGGKVCGAGGGGCLFCLGEPDRIPAIREAIAAKGGRLLDFTIEAEGLRVDTRVTV